MTRRAIKTSTYIIMPIMIGLAVCAEPLVSLILTNKWLPCFLFLRVFSISYAFYPIHTANLNAVKAMSRSDFFLKLEIKIIGLSAILITMWISVEAMAYSLLVTTLLNQIINSWPNKKLLGYSYLEQIKDRLPQIGLSLIMGAAIYLSQLSGFSNIFTLCIQIPLGMILYIALSKMLHIESFEYVISMLESFKRKRIT